MSKRRARSAARSSENSQAWQPPSHAWRIGALEVIAIVSVLFLLIAYLWPRHRSYPDALRRSDCFHRMQHVATATLHYAVTHDGTYPDDAKSCPEVRALDSRDLICPASDLESDPPHARLAGAALDASEPVSYVYVGGGVTTTTSPDIVIWLEPTEDHQDLGMNVAFADGHIEWLDAVVADEVLSQAKSGMRPVKLVNNATTQP